MHRSETFLPSSCSKNLSPLDYPNCVHLTEHCRCDILNVKHCQGAGCSFCSSESDRSNSENKWNERLESLSEDEQNKIACERYGGHMPWKK